MAKLILRDACYTGIKDVNTKTLEVTHLHKQLVKESNLRIEEKRRTCYAGGIF